MKIIKWANKNMHVSQETVKELEETLQKVGMGPTIVHKRNIYNKVTSKTLLHIFIYGLLNIKSIIPRVYFLKGRFCVSMGDEYEKCMRYFFFSKENGAYFFDCWPDRHLHIENFIRHFNVKYAFFSSEQVTDLFSKKLPGTQCKWLPEAINLSSYRHTDFHKKDIDVLQFGRRYDLYHDSIKNALEERLFRYLYEEPKGSIVFPNQHEFINGLSRTKISICFPSSLTHPKRSGNINTMTVRYLQSMASKCLIVGVMPEEMKQLFDYCPIVEVDCSDPAKQLLEILKNYTNYIPLIERNYETVKNNHTWQHRCEKITDLLTKA